MTVSTTNITSGPYVGNNVAVSFSYTFRLDLDTQVNVYETDLTGLVTLLTLGTDYTVAGLGSDIGGLITRVAGALPTGFTWYIRSNRNDTQDVVFSSQGGFFPVVHESAMDNLTFLVQQLRDTLTRSVRLTDSDPTPITSFIPADRTNKVIGFGATDELQMYDLPTTNAAASATAAAASATAAAASETNATASETNAAASAASVNRETANGTAGLDGNTEVIHLPAGAAAAAAGTVLQKDGTWVLRQVQHTTGAAIASAATVDLTAATGDLVHITGTTPITAWTINSSQRVKCIADAALPLTFSATTNALNSGGIDITLSAGDRFDVYTDGTTVRVDIMLLNGKAVASSAAANQPIKQTHLTTTSSQALTGAVRADITGLTATITPTNATKRIKVSVRWNGEGSSTNNQEVVFGIRRNGVDIGNPAAAGVRAVGMAIIAQGYWTAEALSTPDSCTYEYIDSPASGAAITYTATILSAFPQTLYNQRTVIDVNAGAYERLTSTITLEEID